MVFDGQSLNQYPAAVQYKAPGLAVAGKGVPYAVAAIDGAGWYVLTNTKTKRLHPLFNQFRNSVLMMNGGTADMSVGGTTAAVILETMRAYAQAARDAGCDVVVAYTITTYTGITGPVNAIRNALNALILANVGDPAYWEFAVDMAGDPGFQNPAGANFYDGLHYSAAGHAAAAAVISPVLDKALQLLQLPVYKG